MKKNILLFILMLFTSVVCAQFKVIEDPIIGLGEFYFKMSQSEVTETIESVSSGKSTVSLLTDDLLSATNLKLAGHKFDRCLFTFDSNGLRIVLFTKYLDEKDQCTKEYLELLGILEKDYGEQRSKDGESFTWRSNGGGLLMFYKDYDKKKKKYTITISSSAFSL